MSKDKDQNSEDEPTSPRESAPPEKFDGDLNFATDSTPGLKNNPRLEKEAENSEDAPEESAEKTWVMFNEPAEKADAEFQDAEPSAEGDSEDEDAASVSDTWVPGQGSEPPDDMSGTVVMPERSEVPPTEDGQPDGAEVSDTWVPLASEKPAKDAEDSTHHDFSFESASTNEEADDEAEEVDQDEDPNKTWVPTGSPTVNGEDLQEDAEADTADTDKTWVPSATPTVSGEDLKHDSDPEIDADKTWVPSETPTVNGEELKEDEQEVDTDKTWVPSQTPTVTGEELKDDAAEVDVDKTWVPSQTPTVSGNEGLDTSMGTVVMPRDEGAEATDSAVMDTVAGPVDVGTDKTQIFSQTMGMRGLTEDEYDEWQEEVAEKSQSDTAVRDDEQEPTDSTLGNRTQIWSKQSNDGLDASLTIRSRPVDGVKEFSNMLGEDSADYQIVEKLAEGGMGAIYIANQRSLDRELAIKTLKPLRDSEVRTFTKQGRISQVQKQRREMFLSEALVTANLVHPHIIPIHDLCQTGDGSPFYSMKRVNGTPWNELIADMPLDENLEVLHKVCDAMAYAHHNGVVNRDLKPENCMLGEFGEVLVLDWGLAVPATDADKKRVASPSASFGAGTPAYMSPELWAGPADAIGPCSDIYLLGAILFEAITGKPPHRFPEPDSKAGNSGLWMVIDKVVRKNEIRKSDVTGELMDIALKAMATDPADRHATVLEFQEAIKNFQKHEESRRLSTRATETLEEAAKPGQQSGYQSYQTAAALFEESFTTWPENNAARDGLRKTRLDYATLAHTNGDYDLGLQIAAQEKGGEFDELTGRLSRSRRIRNGLKSATVAALAIIVVGGVFSAYQAVRIGRQNSEITQLYGTKETLEKEKGLAEEAKQQAEQERFIAETAKKTAEAERKMAMAEKQAAEEERRIVEKQKQEAEAATLLADAARQKAETDRAEAEAQKKMAVQQQMVAEKAKADAEKLKLLAENQKALAEKQLVEVETQVAGLEVQKARAGVNLHNAEIANLIRSADYSSALRGVDELIAALDEDPELRRLPEVERNQRRDELQARRKQLLRRTIQTENPVQAQVISPSGRRVAWGDQSGRLQLWSSQDAFEAFPDKPVAQVGVDAAFSSLQFSDDEKQVIATAGKKLVIWNPDSNQLHEIPAAGGRFTTVRLAGDLIVAADTDGNIRAWNLTTRDELWKIRSAASIRDIILLPESGMFLYAGSRGGESSDILAYQLPDSGASASRPKRLGQLRLPRSNIDPPRKLCVSPSEQTLVVSNSRNGDLLILPRRPETEMTKSDRFPFTHPADLKSAGETTWLVSHHQRPVNDVNFSADGKRLVTASDDRTIGVWSLISNSQIELIERLEGHGGRVNAAAFLDEEGKRVLSASADRFCRFWNVDDYRQHRREIEARFDLSSILDGAVTKADRSSRRRKWIPAVLPLRKEASVQETAVDDAEYRVLNADGRTQRGSLGAVALSDDGRAVVTASSDGTAVLWNLANGEPVDGVSTRSASGTGRFEEGHDFNVARLRFLPPDGQILLTTGFDGNLCLWDANIRQAGTGRQEVRVPGLGLVNAIATSADGKLIVTSSTSESGATGAAAVWATESLLQGEDVQAISRLEGFHRAEVSALTVSPDAKFVATGARDGRVAVWNAETGERIAGGQMHARNTIVSHLEWIADKRVLTAGFDGRIQTVTWPEENKGSLQVETAYQHDRIPVERLAVAPDRSRFITISVRTDKAEGTVTSEMESWDVSKAEADRRIRPAIVGGRQPQRIVSANWSPDGDKLAAVVDGNLQIFDSQTWRIENVLEAPGVGISDAVFAPQKNSIGSDVVATFDGTAAHLWKLSDRSHIAAFRPLYAIQSIAFKSHGENPVLLTGDRAIRIFAAGRESAGFGETLFKITDPHRGVVTSLQWSPVPNANQFVSTGADGSATLWTWDSESKTAAREATLSEPGVSIVSCAWSPDGTDVLLARKNGAVELAATREGKVRTMAITESEDVSLSAAAFSSEGDFIAFGGQIASTGESRAWIYDVADAKAPALHATISGHEAGGVTAIRFLPQSPYVATGGADGAALIWNWQPHRTGDRPIDAYLAYQLMQNDSVVAHNAPIESLAVSANGVICSSSEDGTAVVWKNPFRQ